ncbi:hypothetical protein JQX13_38930 [Archangium violaceum]|uniref:hypothetical protein n=1 Tax=Archangium violaceum TaxID=83451 RepID=UPI00193B99D1|nr:hypothetical protein [Archangium violaceum]QRK06057.1 hypothetical protein JQX13_38930 [Archangium violaceum]
MARPRGMPPELLDGPVEGDGGDASIAPDPLDGYEPTGLRGPRTSLTPEMVLVIAREIARTGLLRSAAAMAGTTEDCLDKWLRRGKDAAARKKRSLYTQLYMECEYARAHRRAYLINLGERSITDRHMNPRFATWLLAVTEPKVFTVPREANAAQQGNALGPAFEMVTPEQAMQALEEKARKFLELEDKRAAMIAEATAAAEPEHATPEGA